MVGLLRHRDWLQSSSKLSKEGTRWTSSRDDWLFQDLSSESELSKLSPPFSGESWSWGFPGKNNQTMLRPLQDMRRASTRGSSIQEHCDPNSCVSADHPQGSYTHGWYSIIQAPSEHSLTQALISWTTLYANNNLPPREEWIKCSLMW